MLIPYYQYIITKYALNSNFEYLLIIQNYTKF